MTISPSVPRPILLLLLLAAAAVGPVVVRADHDLPKPSKTFTDSFDDQTVATVKSPTDLYFTPDGRYAFVTSKFGTLWRVSVDDMDDSGNGSGRAVPEQVFEVPHPMCLNGARGLAGVAVHPAYPAVRHIYLFHNHDKVRSRAGRAGWNWAYQACYGMRMAFIYGRATCMQGNMLCIESIALSSSRFCFASRRLIHSCLSLYMCITTHT